MAARDYQLAREFLNAFKVKSVSPRAPGYVISKYGYLPYDRILYYARKMFPDDISRNNKEDEDYMHYLITYQSADPYLAPYFSPGTTPDESDQFHDHIAQEATVPTPEQETEHQKNKNEAEEAYAAEPAAAQKEVKPAEPTASETPTSTPPETVAAEPAAAAEVAVAAPATPPLPATHTEQEAQRAEWMAKAEPPPAPKATATAAKAAKKKGGALPKPKFGMVGGQPIILQQPRRNLPKASLPSPVKDAANKLQIISKPVALYGLIGAGLGLVTLGPVGALLGAAGGIAARKFIPARVPEIYYEEPEEYEEYYEEAPEQAPQYYMPVSQPDDGGSQSYSEPERSAPVGSRGDSPNFTPRRKNPAVSRVSPMAKQLAKQAAKQLAREGAALLAASPVPWFVGGALLVIVVLFFMFRQGFPTTALCVPWQQVCGAGGAGGTVLPPGGPTVGGSGNLLSCNFSGVSGDLKIGNPDLANYISDVATKVGIPASVLAGVIRIESQTAFTSTNPDYFKNDYDATVSYAGAIGIAQFEPDTFDGVFLAYQDQINQLFGLSKTGDQITTTPQIIPPPNDSTMRITSIKDSIIVAAFKIKAAKEAAVGPSAPWDTNAVQAVARAYQGGCDNNYCNDLVKSFQDCTGTTVTGPHPTPPATTLPLDQAIQNEFGIRFIGFDDQHLQWARAKLWETSATNFPKLESGTVVTATSALTSFTNCGSSGGDIQLHQYQPEDYFKFILTHEMGHVIQSCDSRQASNYAAQANAYSVEGPISFYAGHAYSCNGLGSPPEGNGVNEDYADMVAYYLNPNSGFTAAPGGCGAPPFPPNPYLNNGSPLHHNAVQSVLGGF